MAEVPQKLHAFYNFHQYIENSYHFVGYESSKPRQWSDYYFTYREVRQKREETF